MVVRERHPALATSRLAAFAIEAVRLAHEFRGTRARASVALGGLEVHLRAVAIGIRRLMVPRRAPWPSRTTGERGTPVDRRNDAGARMFPRAAMVRAAAR